MKNILIDTDMGNDDIMAILIVLCSPNVKISAITTVNGVSGNLKGSRNLITILTALNIKIPILSGSKIALKEKLARFPDTDRTRAEKLKLLPSLNSFNCNAALPFKYKKVEDYIFEKSKRTNTVLALGPLTNIAKTILKYKNTFIKNINEIIIMGGAINKGNVSSRFPIEYNILLDPEAAEIVFNSGIKIKMVGMDCISKLPATKNFMNKVIKIKTNDLILQLIKEIIVNNKFDFKYFYDPLAAYILLDPSIIKNKIYGNIQVVLKGNTRGQTLVKIVPPENVEIILDIYAEKFYNYVLRLLTESN